MRHVRTARGSRRPRKQVDGNALIVVEPQFRYVPTDFARRHHGATGTRSPVENAMGFMCASAVTASIPTRMNNGSRWYAWIDYDGTTLSLRVSQTRYGPTATLSYAVNLQSVLGTTQACVGFTSGTGAAFENHDAR